jgi:hypothetical protein
VPRGLGQPETGGSFPQVETRFVLLTMRFLSQAPRLGGLCPPHGYLSGAAVSPQVCIRPQLRPKDLPTACTGGRGTGSFLAVVLSFHRHAS